MKREAVRVIVVDDDKDAADTLAALLRLNGYEARTASTAEEALILIDQDKPHCVLFDVLMPGMGGEALCKHLRQRYGDDIVLIGVSGYGDERVKKSFEMADHFFTKPVDATALASALPPLT